MLTRLGAAVAGLGRKRAVLRGLAGSVTLVGALAVAGSAPAVGRPGDDVVLSAHCLRVAQHIAAKYRNEQNVSVALICERPDGTVLDPKLWVPVAPAQPTPTPAMTADYARCVTGPGRPTIAMTLTTAWATVGSGKPLIYEFQQLGDSATISSSGSDILEFTPGDLAPGRSYRWRARIDDTDERAGTTGVFWEPDDKVMGWSPWCEFTVSADAVDYRKLGDVSLEALTELRLRPDRTYTVRLSGRQQRLLRAGTDVGRTKARMTLTGPRWTDLVVQLTASASIADEVAAEAGRDDAAPPDGTAYRALVDAISVALGGPAHPKI